MQKLKQNKQYGIGTNLKKLRIRSKLTQDDIIAQLYFYGINMSRITYSKIENSKYSIRLNELLALSEILNCNDFNLFFEGIEKPKKIF